MGRGLGQGVWQTGRGVIGTWKLGQEAWFCVVAIVQKGTYPQGICKVFRNSDFPDPSQTPNARPPQPRPIQRPFGHQTIRRPSGDDSETVPRLFQDHAKTIRRPFGDQLGTPTGRRRSRNGLRMVLEWSPNGLRMGLVRSGQVWGTGGGGGGGGFSLNSLGFGIVWVGCRL